MRSCDELASVLCCHIRATINAAIFLLCMGHVLSGCLLGAEDLHVYIYLISVYITGISEQAEDDADMYSNDDSDSLLSVSLNNSTIPLCIKPTVLHRSLSCEEHDGRSDSLVGLDDSFFENVLQKNIALWKNQTKTNQEHIYENVKTDVT